MSRYSTDISTFTDVDAVCEALSLTTHVATDETLTPDVKLVLADDGELMVGVPPDVIDQLYVYGATPPVAFAVTVFVVAYPPETFDP